MKKYIDLFNRKISIQYLIAILLFVLSLGIFTCLATAVYFKISIGFDAGIINYVRMHETQAIIEFMMVFTFFGSAQFLLPVYIILILFYLFKKNKSYAFDIALIGILSTLIMFLIKNIFKRHRPPVPIIKSIVGYSFPSGHSLSTFVFCSILGYLIVQSTLKKSIKFIMIFLLIVITLTIGLSRIILNVHYPSDVLAGFCMGYILVFVAFCINKKIRNKEEDEMDSADEKYC